MYIYTYIMSIDDECYGEYKAEEWDGESEEALYILNQINGEGLPEEIESKESWQDEGWACAYMKKKSSWAEIISGAKALRQKCPGFMRVARRIV